MFRAMMVKELRETRGIALIALVVFAIMLMARMSYNVLLPILPSYSGVPFVNDTFVAQFYFVAAMLGAALGLRQTLGESYRGTYPFLLHLPTRRRWLIGAKLLAGAGVYVLCTAVPLLAYTLWAAPPGTHASPFEWSMSAWVWLTWFAITLVYEVDPVV